MQKRLILAGALYFGYYMALGSYNPFINLYYDRLGLSGVQIGVLAAIPVLVSSTTVLLWGGIADARQWHRGILRLNLLLCAVAVLMLSTASTFVTLIPWIVAYAFFNSPLVPLLDSSTLGAVEKTRRSYGEIRVWGSIGWTLSTFLVGWIIQQYTVKWFFYIYAAVMAITFLISVFQPRPKPLPRPSVRSGLVDLLSDMKMLLFLLSIFLVSVTLGAANSFLSIYLDAIGTPEASIGLAWSLSAASEIPVMLYSGVLIRRISSAGLLKISFVVFFMRWLLMSFITDPTLAVLVQGLHGLSFATLLIGSVTLLYERAPEGLVTTGQSVLNLVTFGVGSIAGSLIGGFLVESAGLAWLFRVLSVFAASGLFTFLVSQRPRLRPLLPDQQL